VNKKILYIFVILALASLGLAPSSNAAAHSAGAAQPIRTAAIAYYVDNTNLTCSDTLNDGKSSATPFCTIGKAAGLAVAGDSVHVLAGTYLETVSPANNGSSGNPITFTADPGVTVKGNGTSSGSGFRLSSRQYITINGFTVTGTVDHGIYVSGSSNINITNNTVYAAGAPTTGNDRAGIYFSGVSTSTINGNTTHENSSHGIVVQASSSNVTISNNRSYGNASVVSRWANGILLQTASTNITVIHNIVYNNEDSGIGVYDSSNNALIIGNLSYGNSDHGIDVNNSKNATIVGNTVQGNATSGINLEGNDASNNSSGASIQNNLSVSNGINPPANHFPGNFRIDTVSITGTTLNYNLVYQSTVLVEYTWGSTDYTTLSAFQSATGQGAADKQADPLFVAPASPVTQPVSGGGHPPIAVGDYHLQAASPAIDSANSGAPSEPSLDLDGNSRVDYAGTPNTGTGPRTYDDRGAYEYQLPVPQTITFTSTAPTNAVYAGPTYTPTATGGASGNPVVITIDASASTICSISAGVVSFIGVGTCVIDANQAGGYGYDPAPQVQQSFAVGKANQIVTFTSTAPSDAVVGGPTYTPTATGGASGNPVVISLDVTSTGCSVNAGIVSFTAVGTCIILADQAGNDLYNTAPQVQQTIPVGKGSQTITFTSTAPVDAVVDGPTYIPTAMGGASGNPVVFTLDATSTGCSLSAGVISFPAVGTCVIDANQAGDANYNAALQVQQSITVSKINQTLTFTSTAPADAVVGGPTYTPTAAGGASGNPVIFSLDDTSTGCALNAGIVSFTSVGTCKINADQVGNTHYNPAPQVQQSFPVGKGSQVITFTSTAPTDAVIGGGNYTPTATGGPSGNPVIFTIDGSALSICSISVQGVVSFHAAGTCVINADQAGDANYNAAPQVQQSFPVGKIDQVIAFTSIAPAYAIVGGPTYTPTAVGGASGNPVVLTIDASASSVCSISGLGVVSFIGAGTCKINANQAGNDIFNAATQVQQTFPVTMILRVYLPLSMR
jgi:parallel beta-helix repeat protein